MNAPNQNPLTITLQIIEALAHAVGMSLPSAALEIRFNLDSPMVNHYIKQARHLGAKIRRIPPTTCQPVRYQITSYPPSFAESVQEWLAYQEARQYCSRLNSFTGNETQAAL